MMIISVLFPFTIGALMPSGFRDPNAPDIAVHAIALSIPDIDEGIEFYEDVLGFETTTMNESGDEATLIKGTLRLVLREDEQELAPDPGSAPRMTLNFFVRDLEKTIENWTSRGVSVSKPEKIVIGSSAVFNDPFGNSHHVLQIRGREATALPQVFNVSLNVRDLDAAMEVYCHGLGLEIFSLKYLPPTLPLKKHGAVPLVIHYKPDAKSTSSMRVVFSVSDVHQTLNRVKARGAAATKWDQLMGFRDSDGLAHELIEHPKGS